jgi:RNA-directed DNA polymerase
MWERHGKQVGELTRYADDFVVVCKTRKDTFHAFKLIQTITERLELTLHPEKTELWDYGRVKKDSTPRHAPPEDES